MGEGAGLAKSNDGLEPTLGTGDVPIAKGTQVCVQGRSNAIEEGLSLGWYFRESFAALTGQHVIEFPTNDAIYFRKGRGAFLRVSRHESRTCLLYTSDAADE